MFMATLGAKIDKLQARDWKICFYLNDGNL